MKDSDFIEAVLRGRSYAALGRSIGISRCGARNRYLRLVNPNKLRKEWRDYYAENKEKIKLKRFMSLEGK